jgi:UDP-glucose 4-epimerase
VRCLVTGGAGFIGRWVVARLLDAGHQVTALDDLSNGRAENLRDVSGRDGWDGLIEGDLKDPAVLDRVFAEEGARGPFDSVFHLGASIHVQKSIDDPTPTFRNDVEGTFQVLERCRAQYFRQNGLDPAAAHFDFERDVPRLVRRGPRVAVMSTCMVYDLSDGTPIAETHPYRPASPYAAAKIGADMLALSYFHAYRMPVTVVRPFNTYGPFQKSNGEGGVVSIFLKRALEKQPLLVKGSGEQTRDLLYVEDCAEFVVACGASVAAEGQIVNAGTGRDVSVNRLAELCSRGQVAVEHVTHDHPQAEIARLVCDSTKAERLLGWRPRTTLEQGIDRTRRWLAENRWAW